MVAYANSDCGNGHHNGGNNGDHTFSKATDSGSDEECDEHSDGGSVSSESVWTHPSTKGKPVARTLYKKLQHGLSEV